MINKEGLHSIIKSTLNISINKNIITGLWEDRRGWSRRRRVWRSLSEVSLLWSGPGSSSCTLLQTFPVSSPAGQVNINFIIFCTLFFYHFVVRTQATDNHNYYREGKFNLEKLGPKQSRYLCKQCKQKFTLWFISSVIMQLKEILSFFISFLENEVTQWCTKYMDIVHFYTSYYVMTQKYLSSVNVILNKIPIQKGLDDDLRGEERNYYRRMSFHVCRL